MYFRLYILRVLNTYSNINKQMLKTYSNYSGQPQFYYYKHYDPTITNNSRKTISHAHAKFTPNGKASRNLLTWIALIWRPSASGKRKRPLQCLRRRKQPCQACWQIPGGNEKITNNASYSFRFIALHDHGSPMEKLFTAEYMLVVVPALDMAP